MKTFKAFPEIQIPPFWEGWDDSSWGNDITASVEMEIPDFGFVRAWVYNDDPNKREYKECPKYCVELLNEDGDTVDFWQTDSPDEAQQAVEFFLDSVVDGEYHDTVSRIFKGY